MRILQVHVAGGLHTIFESADCLPPCQTPDAAILGDLVCHAHAASAVPVPECVIDVLISADTQNHPEMRLFPFGRTYAWQQVKRVMTSVGIIGIHASPRGLRHGFGVAAIQAGVPLTLVQKWLGHANIATTAIYTNAIEPDEREIAKRMW